MRKGYLEVFQQGRSASDRAQLRGLHQRRAGRINACRSDRDQRPEPQFPRPQRPRANVSGVAADRRRQRSGGLHRRVRAQRERESWWELRATKSVKGSRKAYPMLCKTSSDQTKERNRYRSLKQKGGGRWLSQVRSQRRRGNYGVNASAPIARSVPTNTASRPKCHMPKWKDIQGKTAEGLAASQVVSRKLAKLELEFFR